MFPTKLRVAYDSQEGMAGRLNSGHIERILIQIAEMADTACK